MASKCLTVLILISLTSFCCSISPLFISSYLDVQASLRRLTHCVPMPEQRFDSQLSESQNLVGKVKQFLDYADYEPEQLTSINELLAEICNINAEVYQVSRFVDEQVSNSKEKRCKALEDIMNFMHPLFKHAAQNKATKLDFSTIVFYPTGNAFEFYNLTDLIITSWVRTNVQNEFVCELTSSLRNVITTRMKVLQELKHASSRSSGTSLMATIGHLFKSVFGRIISLQRRAFGKDNILERIAFSVSNGLNATTNTVGRSLERVGSIFFFGSSSTINSNVTRLADVTQVTNATEPAPIQ